MDGSYLGILSKDKDFIPKIENFELKSYDK